MLTEYRQQRFVIHTQTQIGVAHFLGGNIIIPVGDLPIGLVDTHADFIQRAVGLMCCYLSDLLNIVLRQKSLSEPNGTQNGIGMIVQFLYLLYTNYAEHHEVQWYAERLLVSPNALSVALKKAYGKSANAFIDELLLEKAKQWLSDPNYSVQQVADMLCFSDQSAFGKFFKRCSGISPSAYRCRKGV